MRLILQDIAVKADEQVTSTASCIVKHTKKQILFSVKVARPFEEGIRHYTKKSRETEPKTTPG